MQRFRFSGLSWLRANAGTYSIIDFRGISSKLGFAMRSTMAGSADTSPRVELAMATGTPASGNLSISRVVDAFPTMVSLSVTFIAGAATAADFLAAMETQISEINALALGAPLELLGHPLDPTAVLATEDSTGGGTIGMPRGTDGSLTISMFSPGNPTVIELTAPKAFITLDTLAPLNFDIPASLWLDDAIASALTPDDKLVVGTIEIPH